MVPAGSTAEDNICPICHEEFDQFYKQDFADSSSSTGKWGVGKFRINALTPLAPVIPLEILFTFFVVNQL